MVSNTLGGLQMFLRGLWFIQPVQAAHMVSIEYVVTSFVLALQGLRRLRMREKVDILQAVLQG